MSQASRLERLVFRGHELFIKRDDELGELNGNKARKLEYLLKNPPKGRLISYGSNQGNAMLALSIYARNQGLEFLYFSRYLSEVIKKMDYGNLHLALQNGMCLVECDDAKSAASSALRPGDTLIPQGVACKEAEKGFKTLADELHEDLARLKARAQDFAIFLPAGTGTSAYFLAKHTKISVYTTPCVGDEAYLRQQMQLLGSLPENLFILKPALKAAFAKPKREYIALYDELLASTKIEFDLLYDMQGFLTLLGFKTKKRLIYIHQGGVEGNVSMLKRYEHLGLR